MQLKATPPGPLQLTGQVSTTCDARSEPARAALSTQWGIGKRASSRCGYHPCAHTRACVAPWMMLVLGLHEFSVRMLETLYVGRHAGSRVPAALECTASCAVRAHIYNLRKAAANVLKQITLTCC